MQFSRLMDWAKNLEGKAKPGKLSRSVAKVLQPRALNATAEDNGSQKMKSRGRCNGDQITSYKCSLNVTPAVKKINNEKLLERAGMEALLAQLFAVISAIKASYAQLQFAQSPYDPEGVQSADRKLISELRNLSELKQCYVKKQLQFSSKKIITLAEIQEHRSVLKAYEITVKKLESQSMIKDSEISILKKKLDKCNQQNEILGKCLQSTRPLIDHLQQSAVSTSHFIAVLQHAVKSIRKFVSRIVGEMDSFGWDFDVAASAIQPGVVYWKESDKCFALESFVCREMFGGFHCPNYSLPDEPPPQKMVTRQHFFQTFNELKSVEVKEYISTRPTSTFAKFCQIKYLRLIHPLMESSFCGSLNQRNLVESGRFPDAPLFTTFVEMAKQVWLLHCLAFSMSPEASIFQVLRGQKFSEVSMESVTEEPFLPTENSSGSNSLVAFTVIPGFRIGRTFIQCQVYLSKQ